jgi:hypothetical protein
MSEDKCPVCGNGTTVSSSSGDRCSACGELFDRDKLINDGRTDIKIGDPVLVFTGDISGVDRKPCILMRDTDRDTDSFILGRIYMDPETRERSNFSSHSFTVITPAGVVVNAVTAHFAYVEAQQLLVTWEDWENEKNGVVYGGYFEQTGLVDGHIVWHPTNPFRDEGSTKRIAEFRKRQKHFVMPTEPPKADKELTKTLNSHAEEDRKKKEAGTARSAFERLNGK